MRRFALFVFIVLAAAAWSAPAFSASVTGDFNGDGVSDLAVAAPGRNVGAGAVYIAYGTRSGLGDESGAESFSEAFCGDPGESGDGFASALATGDFNGDGLADLAIGIPYEDVDTLVDAGAVCILYGSSSTGLSEHQFWTQDTANVNDTAETADHFGAALAVGNFGRSSKDDLAIGVPREELGGQAAAGAVNVLYGGADGLTATGDQLWHQDVTGIRDTAETDDWFGGALTAANFGKSHYADLAVAALYEDVGTVQNAGAVNVIYGTSAGLKATGDQFWTQNSPGIVDKAEAGDRFGFSLAAANLGKSSQADLAVGVDLEDVGAIHDAGAVQVIYGSSTGLRATGNRLWHQNRMRIADASEADDLFGFNLIAANFGKSSHADLAIDVWGEDVGGVSNAGAVAVLYGTSTGLSAAGSQLWTQNTFGIDDGPETSDHFGIGLGAGNFGSSGQADLAIGIPYEELGAASDAGAIEVVYGASGGLSAFGSQLLDESFWGESPGVEDTFGTALGPRR